VTRAASLVALLGIVAVASPRADIRTSRQDATLLKQKVAVINAHAEKGLRQSRRTTLTESEVNS